MSVARTKRPKRAHLIKAGRVAAKALELLEKVNDLIRDKDGWTRAAFVRDGDGKSTEPGEPEACSFCLVGALSHVYETEHAAALAGEGTVDERLAAADLVREGIARARALVDSLIRETGWQTLVSGWNDQAGHKSVKRMVRLQGRKVATPAGGFEAPRPLARGRMPWAGTRKWEQQMKEDESGVHRPDAPAVDEDARDSRVSRAVDAGRNSPGTCAAMAQTPSGRAARSRATTAGRYAGA